MKVYNTVQKQQLLEFLKNNSDRAFTIEEIASEISVGKSTVYRLMPKLVDEGIAKRFTKGTSRRFLYQLIGCGCHAVHLHMKCTQCGRILHMSNAASETLLQEVLEKSNFSVDKEQTMLFGKCAHCR